MRLDKQKFLQEIDCIEKEQIGKGASAWGLGIKEGIKIVRELSSTLFEDKSLTLDQIMNKMKKKLQIDEIIEGWRGNSSCLGEEIEWFNGICKVYEETENIIRKCKID